MEGADYYINDAEYMDEVLDWIKEWICLYKKYAVLQDENGRLKQIKGSIVFGTDLELSLEGRMTVETKSRYEAEAAKLREKPELFEKKAGYSFGRGTAVPLEYLFRVFGLTAAERFVVCMSASVEYDRTFGRMFSLLQDDYKEIYPTMDLCLKIYTPYEQERLACRSALLSEKSRLKYFFQSPPEKISGPLILHPRRETESWRASPSLDSPTGGRWSKGSQKSVFKRSFRGRHGETVLSISVSYTVLTEREKRHL